MDALEYWRKHFPFPAIHEIPNRLRNHKMFSGQIFIFISVKLDALRRFAGQVFIKRVPASFRSAPVADENNNSALHMGFPIAADTVVERMPLTD